MDGSTSHNVFGIKANSQWKGRTVDAMTTEYVDGVALRKVEKFRAYDNYADAFKDYARLITDNPRYQNVMQNGGSVEKFASELQKAGYATDPHYAQKLTKIIKQSLSG
jgi:flagellar protein FlgJ